MAEIDLSAFSNTVALGSGGLGDVYRATRRSTGGEVAIKVLRDWSDRDVARQRAQRELRALVDLRGHANVVNVEEVIETDGALAIVMEYAPGGSVADLMRQQGGTVGFPETLLIATHTAAALAASHERGIIHRDIKPHNLLIGPFGQVKVCDFGIAALTRSEEVSNRTNSLSLRYASPEELRSSPDVGPAADIYSLAATIHHLLTGQYLPTPDGTAGSLPLRSWMAPEDIPSDVELEFRQLVVRCADRNPANRPTAAELHDDFDALSVRLGPRRCRALTPAVQNLDDATQVRSVEVGGFAAPTVVPVTTPDAAGAEATTARSVPDPASTVVRTTRVQPTVAPPPPPGRSRSKWLLGLVAVVVAALALGGVGYGLGWFGTDAGNPSAADSTTADTTAADTTVAPTTATTLAPTTVAATTTAATTTTAAATTTTVGPICPGAGACITIESVDIVDGEYSITWRANFTPSLGSTHAHFFWDIYQPDQVGSTSPNQAPWELTDQQPFVPTGEMRMSNRPPGATGLCVTAADASHAVIDPQYYQCVVVAAGATWPAP